MSWISTNNLRRFADKLFHGNLSFGGSVTHNGATTFNGGVKVNTTKAEFAAPVSFTGTTTYKGNEVVTKNDIYTKTESDNKYPTKTGTGASGTWAINISGNALNDSDGNKIVDTYVKKSEVGGTPEWKEAYNALRKRSYPTVFDNDELTLIMDKPIVNTSEDTNIILSQPYTNFDGLLFDIISKNSDRIFERIYVSSAEINNKKKIAMHLMSEGIGNGAMFLFSNSLYCACQAYGISTTEFTIYKKNCYIRRIYGVKFKEIT